MDSQELISSSSSIADTTTNSTEDTVRHTTHNGTARTERWHTQATHCDCRMSSDSVTGAINLNDRALLSHFFHSHAHGSHLAIIFHCEFSQNRAPKSYRFFRSMDRTRNAAAYPALSFPEIAVLDGGYRAFFENHPTYCSPQAYVSMWDDAFQRECKEQTSKHRKSWGTGKALLAERDDGMQLPAARGLRRRSNTQVGGGEFSLARAASALEPVSGNSFFQAHSPARAASYTAGSSQAAAAAAAPSCMVGLSPAATRTSDEGASAAASATHSPLPSFSLASAANSPADVSFGAAAAAASSSLLPPLFTTPLPAARPLYAYQISPLAQLAFEGEDPEDAPIRMDTEREGIARTLAAH